MPVVVTLENGTPVINVTVVGSGPAGRDGADGQDGAPGIGIASGGTTGQYLKKASSTDYDTTWDTLPVEVFWCIRGTTTSAQIEAAYQAGKLVCLQYSSRTYTLAYRQSATKHWFCNAYSSSIWVITCDNDTWSSASSTTIPSAATSTPNNPGTAAVGTSTKYARQDHIHNSEVTWVTTSSSSADVEAAYQAGKIVCLKASNRIYTLVYRSSSTSHTFVAVEVGHVYRYLCYNGSWSLLDATIGSPGTNAPKDLGTADKGTATAYAREDHVHKMPSASDVGAIATPASPNDGDVLTYDSDNDEWVAEAPGGGTTEVAWFTYGTSTSAQIEAAYQAGKVCMATRENDTRVYILSDRLSATDHIFTAGTATRLYYVECNNGTWTNGSRLIPAASSTTPSPLGTASAGDGTTFARSNHVHAMPSASDVGAVAVAQGVAHAGEFVVVGSDGNVTTVTLATWQGGSF